MSHIVTRVGLILVLLSVAPALVLAGDLGVVRVEARLNQGKTIVAFNGAQIGRGLILTCGHCCQSAGGRGGRVTVQIMAQGSWKPTRSAAGSVLCYDAEADCGLIRLDEPDALETMYVLAPRETRLQAGMEVYAFRWRHAPEEMVPLRGRITRLNPFLGPPVIETTTQPQPGESGGPLLLAGRGEIIGVTSAANLEEQRGIYCGLEPIYRLLESCGQTALVEKATW